MDSVLSRIWVLANNNKPWIMVYYRNASQNITKVWMQFVQVIFNGTIKTIIQ